jgi:hypothetical protein
MFEKLSKDNITMFAIKHYDNPQCEGETEFNDDMKRFKYIKRLLRKYNETGELKERLILNHIVIIYNVFGDAAPLLLFYKMERDYWSDIKAIMIFLNKYPEMESDSLHQIAVNDCILQELKEL